MAKIELDVKVEDANRLFKDREMLTKLRKLTLHGYSGMNNELDVLPGRICCGETINCKVILAYHQEELIAWAIVSKEPSDFWFTRGLYDQENGYLFEVFVVDSFRRKGVASELIKAAKECIGDETLCIAPWDVASNQFYANFQSFNNKLL